MKDMVNNWKPPADVVCDPLLDTYDIAKALKVGEPYVRKMCRAGKLPGAKRLGVDRKWRITKSALEVFIAENFTP